MSRKSRKRREKEKAASVKREGRNRRRTNRDIMMVTYFFVFLFVGIIGYLGYFTYVKADEYRTNEYNSKRQTIFADRFIRGDIVSSNGKTLATTTTDDDGNEVREYPYGSMFAHVVGYSTKGNTGIESLASSYLLNSSINPFVRAVYELRDKKSPGDTVVTTLDTRLQAAAYDALGDNKGAVVAINPKTGEILAMVSKPDYDPNEINDIWDELVDSDNKNSNLVNRATQGLYPPGSTFKVITALEYIRENPGTYSNFHFNCDSIYENGEYQIRCSHGVSHGEENLKEAFAASCNGAFASIGETLNFASMYQLCEDFGYNKQLPVNLLSNASKFTLKDSSSLWDVLQTSIGQGQTTITPLHNAMIAAAVANGGVMMEPYVLDHVENENGNVIRSFSPKTWRTVMTKDEADLLKDLMRAVVTDGTGSNAQGDGYTVAGKTGSAEWASGKDTHAWFIGFANVDDPEIAVSVIVEEGGSGGSVAAPVARAVFDAYYEAKNS